MYSRAMIEVSGPDSLSFLIPSPAGVALMHSQRPRFVYVEDEGEISFPIRFAPPAPISASPEIVTPDGGLPITPTVKREVDSVRIVTSPTPSSRDTVAPILKRKATQHSEPMAKKARVAFA